MQEKPKSLEIRVFELIGRLRWLNGLRWIAIAMIAAVIEIAVNFFGLNICRTPLYASAAALTAGNLILIFMVEKVVPVNGKQNLEYRYRMTTIIANSQIAFDLFMLTILLHYAGGIQNTFSFYYIFHIVIASMLLEPLHCFCQAALACLLYSGLVTFEHFGIVDHYSLYAGASMPYAAEKVNLIGSIVAFVSTIVFMCYMATSISMKLRAKENLLLETNLKLVEMDAKKSEFVMIVAHELKSPLGTIQFMIKSLTGGFAKANIDEKTKEVLAKVENRAENLLHFVNELLDLSKIKTGFGSKEFKNISIAEKLKKSIAALEPQANASGITVKTDIHGTDEELCAMGDPEYLENALMNVISNAIKYNVKDGKVDISLYRNDENIIFTCKDTGIGIPPGDIPKIFDEFHRTSISKKHTANGAGIGMSITKKIVEYHRGTITVDSTVGQGTKFIVSLPVNNIGKANPEGGK
ncbi:MAG TPA: HAMP domain-containing sensor histidine kinase [Candidatus Wallbacteria bacterium]|nr:HAMP domain-containing sensor histidine kinase [Candidatus Wallbacteria bacterium]